MPIITHRLVDDSNDPIAGVPVDIDLVVPGDVNAFYNDDQIISHKTLVTNALGSWTIDLIPNILISPTGTTYTATHTFSADEPNVAIEFEVPDSVGTFNVADIVI